jgi:hypothetical protein
MLGFMHWTPLECATQNLEAWSKVVIVICQNNADLCTTLTALVAATEDFLRHEFKDLLDADEDNTAEVCNHSMSYAFNVTNANDCEGQGQRCTKESQACIIFS